METKFIIKLLYYIIDLHERISKVRNIIFTNYGVLDKYDIEMIDDILKGDKNG